MTRYWLPSSWMPRLPTAVTGHISARAAVIKKYGLSLASLRRISVNPWSNFDFSVSTPHAVLHPGLIYIPAFFNAHPTRNYYCPIKLYYTAKPLIIQKWMASIEVTVRKREKICKQKHEPCLTTPREANHWISNIVGREIAPGE